MRKPSKDYGHSVLGESRRKRLHVIVVNRITGSTLALCSLLLSGRPNLQNIQVEGDMIIKPETSDGTEFHSRPDNFS